MKIILPLAIVASILGTTVLGFLAMGCMGLGCAGGSDAHLLCIASKLSTITCPPESNTLAFLNFHVDGLKNVSTAAPTLPFISGMFFAFILLTALIAFALAPWLEHKTEVTSYRRLKLRSSLAQFRLKLALARWLAIFEKRDPALSF